jgi:excisionase family DNA binding protein
MMGKLEGVEWPSPRARAYYSVAETAEIFGMSPMTLYRAIRDEQFPAVRVRGRLFVPVQVIDAMAQAAMERGKVVDAADWVAHRPAS